MCHLERDLLGTQPLYYTIQKGELFYSHDARDLFKIKNNTLKKEIDKNALALFLYLGYVPAPYSIFKGVHKFPQGAKGFFENGEIKITEYKDISLFYQKEIFSEQSEAKEKLKTLLISSVRKCLDNHQKTGVFLSGGIDSSLIAAIAQSLSKHPIHTFTIGFPDSKNNEQQYAGEIAAKLGTIHHEFAITEKEAIDFIFDIPIFYEEPYSDSSAIPTMIVSKIASGYVDHVMLGDGGDEMFLGYGSYQWAKRLRNPFYANFSKIIAWLLSNGNNRQKRAAAYFRYPDKTKIASHIQSQEQNMFSEKEVKKLMDLTKHFPTLHEDCTTSRNLSPVEMQNLFDLKYPLVDDLVVKVARATTRYHLKSSVPILDEDMIRFALNVDQNLKIRPSSPNKYESKYLLRQLLFDYLPAEMFNRKKWGFSIPLEKWLQNKLSFLIEDYLTKSKMEELDINFIIVKKYIKKFKEGETYLYNRLWLLITLRIWYERNMI